MNYLRMVKNTLVIYLLTITNVLALDPKHETVIRDTCEILELNHYYDDSGHYVLDQFVFYDKDGVSIDWRLIRDGREQLMGDEYVAAVAKQQEELLKAWNLKQFPEGYSFRYTPKWIGPQTAIILKNKLILQDGDITRVINFRTLHESHTQIDPELTNRELFPKEDRRLLKPSRISTH